MFIFGHKFGFKSLVFLISLLVILGFLFWFLKQFQTASYPSKNGVLVKFPPFSQESITKIPEHFPRQFIIGDDTHIPEVLSGEVSEISGGQIEMKLNFKTDLDMGEVFQRYKKYAGLAFWEVTSETDAEISKYLVIKRSVRTVSVNITKDPGGSMVVVSYVSPKQ